MPKGRKPDELSFDAASVSEADMAYFAGIIDGEGSIGAWTANASGLYGAKIVMVNTDERLMKWVVSRFGGRYYVFQPGSYGSKPCYRWQETRMRNVLAVCQAIYPYLVIKKVQCRRAIVAAKLLLRKHGYDD